MNNVQANYLIALCGIFRDNYTPLNREEFWQLYHQYNSSLEALVNSGQEHIEKLLARSGAITFAIEDLAHKGIRIVTFLDDNFPAKLREKLGDFCPPLLYACGDHALNQRPSIGYVGARAANAADLAWTKAMVQKNVQTGYGIVTGGAKGVDTAALMACLEASGQCILYIPENLKAKIQDPYLRDHLLAGQLLIYTQSSPFAKTNRHTFTVAALERNRFIYATSNGTVVVHSALGQGGTWAGASDCLKHNWSKVYVWHRPEYPGNQKLIELGGLALSDEGKIVKNPTKPPETTQQMSLV